MGSKHMLVWGEKSVSSRRSKHEQFFWKRWGEGKLPRLESHSETKLELLRDYLMLYVTIVTTGTSGKEEQFVTLVDGFAGGGLYEGGKFGSPIFILQAIEEAEIRINLRRHKPIRITPICYFIEKDPAAFECLEATLRTSGYGDRIGKTIHLHRQRFEAVAPTIIADVNRRHRRGGNRTIFFLDQCGWSEISARTIRELSRHLKGRPEFIINFAITWLTDFISEKTTAARTKSLEALGLDGFVDLTKMMNLRRELGGHWEHAVEAHIGQGFHKATGISHFSPFYIEPEGNHRGYWLLHLASSARARSAMTEIHWSKANRSKHYGYLGYDMLAYKPSLNQTQFIEGMSFDEESRTRCETLLGDDLAHLIRDNHSEGITFKGFLDSVTNKVMATAPMVEDIVQRLCQTKDFELLCPSGRAKRSQKIGAHDRIIPRRQFLLEGLKVRQHQREFVATEPQP